jgi:hypothetical protein
MTFFDGMYSYEIVALIAGVLLFLVLLAALLKKVFTGGSYVGLLPFFLLAIGMIGFPAVTSIKVSAGVVEMQKKTHELQERPQDVALRSSLQADVGNISARSFKNPQTVTALAQAQFALGQEQQAQDNLNKALETAPGLEPAHDLKAKIDVANKLSTLTEAAEKEPDNAQVKQDLQTTVSQASQYKFANPAVVNNISKAKTILAQPANQPAHNPAMLAVPHAGNVDHH